jgi:uroporphyrinogen-III synthase
MASAELSGPADAPEALGEQVSACWRSRTRRRSWPSARQEADAAPGCLTRRSSSPVRCAQADARWRRRGALGREAVVLPLLEIFPLEDQSPLQAALAALPSYALVAFVSPNAIDAAFAHIKAWPQGWRWRCWAKAAAPRWRATASTRPTPPSSARRTPPQRFRKPAAAARPGRAGRPPGADRARRERARTDGRRPARRRRRGRYRGRLPAQRAALDAGTGATAPLAGAAERLDNHEFRSAARPVGPAATEPSWAGPEALLWQNATAARLIVPHARIAETAQALGTARVTLTGSGDERLLAALQSRP